MHSITKHIKSILASAGFLFLLAVGVACNKSDHGPLDGNQELKGTPVKVMTYNIYGARASNGAPADLRKLADVINKYKPDLVALQEVDVYTKRTGITVHQADSLGKLTGMHAFFAKAMDQGGGEYGDAVLSRLPILSSKAYSMGVAPQLGGERRSFALIKVAVEGEEIYFASTHLDHLSNEANRIYQAEELRGIVNGVGGKLIVGGDFNAIPTSSTISIIQEYLTIGTSSFSPTFPSDKPTKTIDYIMFKPASAFYVQNYQVIQEPEVSDHCAVLSILRIK